MNPFIILFAWPVVSVAFFRKYRLQLALLLSVIGGYLILPEPAGTFEIDLPLLPTLDKYSIPSIVAVFMVMSLGAAAARGGMQNGSLPGWLPAEKLGLAALVLLVGGSIMTVLTNLDALVFPTAYVRPLRIYDGFSVALTVIMMILPVLLGRKLLGHPDGQKLLVTALVVAGFIYSFLILYEVRMSPQLNRMVYGYFQSEWGFHLRGGGYRPLVFTRHGLLLAILQAMFIMAAIGYWRWLAPPKKKGMALFVVVWLFATLFLSNSLGALMIVVGLLPVALLLGTRGQLICAAVIAATVLLFPMLRSTGMIPTERVASVAESINPVRAGSLRFRFLHEEKLLAHALERPLFGWGGFGRNRVRDASGQDISITDGYWVLSIGVGGWTRYFGEMGLLCLPLILLTLRARRYEIGPETAILCIVMAANLIDLIPNTGDTPIMWLIAGALWGRLEMGRVTSGQEATGPPDAADQQPRSRYVRGPGQTPDPDAKSGPQYTRQTRRHDRKP